MPVKTKKQKREYAKQYYQKKKYEKYELVKQLSDKIFEDKAENFEPLPILLRERILNYGDDTDFLMARLTSGSNKKIVITKSYNKLFWKVYHKLQARKEDSGKSNKNVIAIMNCYDYSKDRAGKIIESEGYNYIPFFELWLELRSAIDWWMTYGIYYVEL